MALKADRLGDVVAQACLSIVRMSRVVEKAHNSKTAEALLVRQCLEKVSAEAEEDFCKSISTLVSTVITEGAKVPEEHGVVLTSSILCLVPTLPLDLVLAPSIDLPLEKECKITLGDTSWSFPVSQSIASSLPSSPLTRGASAPTVAGRSTIKFGQAIIWPVTFMQPATDYPFFKKPVSTHVSMPQKGWGTPSACSSPLLKESHTSPQDTPDLTKSSMDPSVLIEDEGVNDDDDDDKVPAPYRTGLSNIKGIHKSSKHRESPPTKKVWTEDLGAWKPRSCKMSHTSWDEWSKHDGSKKGPDYKQMHYLTFTLVTELEQFIFEKCSFDQPPISQPSPL